MQTIILILFGLAFLCMAVAAYKGGNGDYRTALVLSVIGLVIALCILGLGIFGGLHDR